MDDYTWNTRVEKRRQRRRAERRIVLFVLIVILSSVIWYFTSYTKTPAYAMNKILETIANEDTDGFNSHVDLTTVTTRAYDDLTGDLFEYDTRLSMEERLLFENFYVLIRPQMCQGAIKVINTKIATDKWILPEEILKGRQLGIDFDLLLERSLIRHTKIIGVENIEHHGETATADVKVMEINSQTPFTLKVTLTNFDKSGVQIDGSDVEIFGRTFKFPGLSLAVGENAWKITSVDNYKEYLATVAPILMQQLDAYIDETQDIVNHYNEIFRAEQNSFIVMQKTPSGIMSDNQRAEIVNWINGTIIPALEARQFELNKIKIPSGAQYLANLRQESTKVTIQAWQFYAQGLSNNDEVSFETAESIHKQELVLDQRIDEIVRYSAVARNLPELP